MLSPAEREADFAAALLDPERPVPPNLVAPPDAGPRRFGVYRNNVTAGLIDVIRESHPALERLVGDEFLRALAVEYVRAHPPRSPLMFAYGDTFADFIAAHPACESLPYLADVARIERAWLDAYHAAEAEPLTASELLGLDAAQLAAIPLRLHPSVRIVTSAWPALTIWDMNVGQAEPEPVDLEAGGEIALVLRPHAEVTVRPINPAAEALLDAIGRGNDLITAAGQCLQASPEADLPRIIEILIDARAFVLDEPFVADKRRMRT